MDTCIGLALDGTGYGPDGTVWGGEVLVADLKDFTRAGHLASVHLPGGEAAVRSPARMAAAYLYAAYGEDFLGVAEKLGMSFPDMERQLLQKQLATGWHSPIATSAGRLFDAVAAAVGICRQRTYEGQAALELEMAADPEAEGLYAPKIHKTAQGLVLDTPAMFRGAVSDRLAGRDQAAIAGCFHQSLARGSPICAFSSERKPGLISSPCPGACFKTAS